MMIDPWCEVVRPWMPGDRARALLCILVAVLFAVSVPAARAAGPATTKRALAGQMARAGSGSGAYVVDLDSGQTLYRKAARTPRIPASVEKLFTSASALLRYGPDSALNTAVLGESAPDPTGLLNGNLYLRGGGDPTLDTAAIGRLASALVTSTNLTEVTGHVIGDETFLDGRRGPPSSRYSTSSDVGPLSGLSINHGYTGRRVQANPPLTAAQALAKALRKLGVAVDGSAQVGAAPPFSVGLTSWNSPSIASIVTAMNVPSDNFYAETLIKDLGANFGTGGSTAAGAAVVRSTLAPLGVRTTLVDGSGLSRSDRTSPRTVVKLLAAMARSAVALPFYGSLPTAGRTGTLSDRMRGTPARDACHAKTGTLSNVSALAGYCTTRVGAHLAFAFLMNSVYPAGARRLQDKMAAVLARYTGS